MSIPTIVDLVQICASAPSQWEGVLSDGRWLHVRYRHGELSVGVGATLDEAVGSSAPLDVELTDAERSDASWEQVAPHVLARLARPD